MNINNKNILLIILLFFILFIIICHNYNIYNLENLKNLNSKEYNNNDESNILKENILIPVAYNTYNNNYINEQNNKKRNNYINNNYLFSKQENSNIDINQTTKATSDTTKATSDTTKASRKKNSITPLIFEKHFENNLPQNWIQEFNNIIEIMRQIFPVYEFSNQKTIKVFAWVDDIEEPPKDPDGNILKGASLSGNNKEYWLVLEISRMEIDNDDSHLYSIIVHEYYHIYQKNNYMHYCVWLIEGTAACLEVFFINDYLNINNFENQFRINETIKNKLKTDPSQYEYYKGTDFNYTGSVYMILILIKELQKKYTLKITLNKIFKEFWETPYNNDNDWRIIFNNVFNINIINFYNIVKTYNFKLSILDLVPNQPLNLTSIFE